MQGLNWHNLLRFCVRDVLSKYSFRFGCFRVELNATFPDQLVNKMGPYALVFFHATVEILISFCSMLDGYYYPDFDTLRVEPEDFSNVFEFNSTWRVYGEGFIMVSLSTILIFLEYLYELNWDHSLFMTQSRYLGPISPYILCG